MCRGIPRSLLTEDSNYIFGNVTSPILGQKTLLWLCISLGITPSSAGEMQSAPGFKLRVETFFSPEHLFIAPSIKENNIKVFTLLYIQLKFF